MAQRRYTETSHDWEIQTDSVSLNLDDRGFMTANVTWRKSFENADLQQEALVVLKDEMLRGGEFPYNDFLGVELYCHKLSTQFFIGGFVNVQSTYAGLLASFESNDRSQYRVEWTCNNQTSPIETHPNFAVIGGDVINRQNNSQWDPDTGEFIGFPAGAPNDLGGVTDFYEPNVTCRISWVAREGKDKLTDFLYDVGKVSKPPADADVPPVGDRNFLLMNVGYNFYAKGADEQIKWEEFTLEYLLSQEGGWNPLIYDPA